VIAILIVEDQALVREGIATLLGFAPDLSVAAETGTAASALELVETLRPDLVLLDLRLPDRSGLAVLEALQARGDATPVIVLTTFEDPPAMLAAARLGARGFLLKSVSFEQLTTAIRAVAAGETLIHPTLAARGTDATRSRETPFDASTEPGELSRRERVVLRLIAAGCSNKEIAAALRLAPGTVKNHVSSLLAKLGVRDRTRAALRGYELGLL
jgi:DNA-binding NarL/FixJ family response regulator